MKGEGTGRKKGLESVQRNQKQEGLSLCKSMYQSTLNEMSIYLSMVWKIRSTKKTRNVIMNFSKDINYVYLYRLRKFNPAGIIIRGLGV